MRVMGIYVTADGAAQVKKAIFDARLIRYPDGDHPVTNDSVWQDSKRLRMPIMIILQDVLGPIGSTMQWGDIRLRLYEMKLSELAFKNQSVSKPWQRMFANFAEWAGKYGITICVLALVVGASAFSMFGGSG